MVKISNLEEGIEQSVKIIEQIQRRPILVAVYGLPNSGKSFFILRIYKQMLDRSIRCMAYGGAPSVELFEYIKEYSKSFLDYSNSIHLFHYGAERQRRVIANQFQDPNMLARRVLRRGIDLNIGIFNPNFYAKITGRYDLIICNPNSILKKE